MNTMLNRLGRETLLEIGGRIRMKRLLAGQSLQQVSEATGISAPSLSEMERGKRQPTAFYLVRLCRHFGVSADWILSGDRASAN